jgi:hypothetical protein
MVENLLDSPIDVATPRPFYAQASPTPRPYLEEDSPEILSSYETPRSFLYEKKANMDPTQSMTVLEKNVPYYPLSKSAEPLSSVHVRHVIIPASLDSSSQYQHFENDGIISIHLKVRTSPFSKEEISYPGGPQFSGSCEVDECVSRIDHTRAVVDWLESQEIFDSLPATDSVDSRTDPDC